MSLVPRGTLSVPDGLNTEYLLRKANNSKQDAADILGMINIACDGEFFSICESAGVTDVWSKAHGWVQKEVHCMSYRNTVLAVQRRTGVTVGLLAAADLVLLKNAGEATAPPGFTDDQELLHLAAPPGAPACFFVPYLAVSPAHRSANIAVKLAQLARMWFEDSECDKAYVLMLASSRVKLFHKRGGFRHTGHSAGSGAAQIELWVTEKTPTSGTAAAVGMPK